MKNTFAMCADVFFDKKTANLDYIVELGKRKLVLDTGNNDIRRILQKGQVRCGV